MIQVEHCEDEVFISVDEEGVNTLIQALQYIKDGGDHDHFMSPAWGGNELSAGTPVKDGSTPVHHLKLFFKNAGS